uniref:Uncharacterized protein n=1 Tax=uncultured marine group II/III euryarchaeote KM3_100_D04 TaxID=1457841 RepID=A0A075G5D0_9EURY|nr:hypothetical protein [uncultured marine group II/III euryarchaeote KM3_100_D04]
MNLPETVIGLMVANAASEAMFGAGIIPFLTEGWLTKRTGDTDNSWELSLAELLNLGNITRHGQSASYAKKAGVGGAIKKNLRDNGAMAVGVIAGSAIANAALKKVGVYRMLNKTVRSIGLGKFVKFT